ncbi:hypothetical protein PJIAN_1939 [Paludibacter jiangxiensis]|uniref:Uncharacterized protein n=1 Tax=Paludibacter jiangxiensis TaxID=681398 RepID=A0A161LIR4_9BACT|nr:hypothetical protein PJIAN_1939 [Paludibacter jiangxiensis]
MFPFLENGWELLCFACLWKFFVQKDDLFRSNDCFCVLIKKYLPFINGNICGEKITKY